MFWYFWIFCFCFMSNKCYLILLSFTRYIFSVNNFFIDEKCMQWNLNTKVKVFHGSIWCFMKWLWNCISSNALKKKVSQCILAFKVDPNSTNVSRATDAICWQIVFFNVHLRWTKCSEYLTNLFCLLTISSNCARQSSYLDLWSNTLYIILVYIIYRLEELIHKLLTKWNFSQAFLIHFTLYSCLW